MPDELRERVAEALWRQSWGRLGGAPDGASFGAMFEGNQQKWRTFADAAIAAYEAARPTESDPATIERMVDAMRRAPIWEDDEFMPGAWAALALAAWRAEHRV